LICLLDKSQEKGNTSNDSNELKKMIFTLREYEERNKKLEGQIQKYETELYGKSADKYASIEVFKKDFQIGLEISLERYAKRPDFKGIAGSAEKN